jgi:hypothetical protein
MCCSITNARAVASNEQQHSAPPHSERVVACCLLQPCVAENCTEIVAYMDNEHLEEWTTAKALYYERKLMASSRPQCSLSIIMDSMDKGKTWCPHYQDWRVSKDLDKLVNHLPHQVTLD